MVERWDDGDIHVLPTRPGAGQPGTGQPGAAQQPVPRPAPDHQPAPVPRRGYRRRQVLWALAGGLGSVAVLRAGRTDVLPPDPGPDLVLPVPGPTPSGTPSPTPAGLPVRPTALPGRIFVEPFPSSTLSRSPVTRGYALLQPLGRDPVAVLGDDGWLRVVDVGGLADLPGGPGGALCSTALAPDGRRAAFGQVDAVTVVEFESARARSVAVPGITDRVAWLGSTLLVVQSEQALLVGLGGSDATVQRAPYRGADVAVPASAAEPVVELTAPVRSGSPAHLSTFSTDGSRGDRAVSGTEPLAGWLGAGWTNGRLLARAAVVPAATPGAPRRTVAVLIDTLAAAVVRTIAPPGDPADPPTRLEVLGWLDPETVLLHAWSPGQPVARVLAWSVRTGWLALVTTVTGAPVTIAVSVPGG